MFQSKFGACRTNIQRKSQLNKVKEQLIVMTFVSDMWSGHQVIKK